MCKIIWNYKSKLPSSSGYEDVLETLKSYTKELYVGESELGKEMLIDEVFKIYRDKNIFTITYYNDDGIDTEIRKCIDKNIKWDIDSGVLNYSLNQGQSLTRFLFPNLQNIDVSGRAKDNTPYFKFQDDHKLRRAIKFCFDHKSTKTPVVPTAIKDGLEMIDGNAPTNYKAMNAKALYSHFCEAGDTTLDFSSGYGGRMLGAMTSCINYIGIEPNLETSDNLRYLGNKIIQNMGLDAPYFKLLSQGSEEPLDIVEGSIDFVFSSPPYFNLEIYAYEDSQCYIKYNTIESWLEGYVKPTIANIFKVLKSGKYYAVNISDFKVAKKYFYFVDEWLRISEEQGFIFYRKVDMKLQSRRGDGHDSTNLRTKQEGIFIFRKP